MTDLDLMGVEEPQSLRSPGGTEKGQREERDGGERMKRRKGSPPPRHVVDSDGELFQLPHTAV